MSILTHEIIRRHDHKAFDCDVDELIRFLEQQACKKTAQHFSKTYVPCSRLSHTAGDFLTMPPDIRMITDIPIPLRAVKSAYLTIDQTYQGMQLVVWSRRSRYIKQPEKFSGKLRNLATDLRRI